MSHKTPDPAPADSSPAAESTINDAASVESLGIPADPPAANPEPSTPTSDAEALRAKSAENWDLYLRTRAEFENYRRRATRERQDAVRYAALGLIEKLLPVLDSLDMAHAATNQADGTASVEALQQGISMIQSQLKGILTEFGVQEINASGQVFDPNLHEAVAHHESADVEDGHVLHQIRKGYLLHDRLVRPATVVVAKAPGA